MRRVPAILLFVSILSGCAGGGAGTPAVPLAATGQSPAGLLGAPAPDFLATAGQPNPPVVAGCQVFPAASGSNPTGENAFNQDISKYPVDSHSATYIATLGGNLHPDFGHEAYYGIPFNVVPATQPKVPMKFVNYPSESDRGPYPFPPNAQIEGDFPNPYHSYGGDRHVLVLQQGAAPGDPCTLYEVWQGVKKDGGKSWQAANGAVFHLNATKLRPNGWTSADAAGLPIFPALIKCQEVQQGAINHAMRVTFNNTHLGFIHPATHEAGLWNTTIPPMGARFRLKASFDISHFNRVSQIILTAMKKYGLFVADNGSNWFFQGQGGTAGAACWNDNELDQLKTVPGSAFEMVYTGPVLDNDGSDQLFLGR